ncbi:MAG: M48 family metalloprotease [Nitrospinales bacterium]
MRRAGPILLVVVFYCGWLVFFSTRLAVSVPFISEETELAMGQGADKQVIAQYGLYQDKALQLYVNRVGQKLVSHLSDQVFRKFFFKIVDSSVINAFALPGGYVYVTRGILALLNNEAELAGVLGHEIGHIIFHHGAKAMVRSIGASILSLGGAIASPQNAGQWLVVSTQFFQQINLGYGRDAELESDAQGIVNLYESGYNPINISRFFRTLRRQEIMSGQSYHSFVASHPETKERIVRAEMMASSYSRRNKKLVDNREVYLSHIKGLVYGGKRDRGDFQSYEDQYIDIYEVVPGDTFAGIAEKELGDRNQAPAIATLNGKRDTESLKPGELLKLVKKGEPPKDKTLQIKPARP